MRDLLAACEGDAPHKDWTGLEEIVLMHLSDRDPYLIEYGTSVRSAWLTDAGRAVLVELRKPTLCRCGHRGSTHTFGYR